MLAGPDKFDRRGNPAPLVLVLGTGPRCLDSLVSVLPVLVGPGDCTVLMAKANGESCHYAFLDMIIAAPQATA